MHPQTERSDFLDGLRGFALFGILLINLMWFKAPFWARPTHDYLLHDATFHRVAEIFIYVFAEGKFFILLALLLGMGVGWQLQRCEERGQAPRRFVARRMVVLFLFGVVHITFLWIGDILIGLALTALLGLLFVRRRTVTLLVAGGIFYLIGAAVYGVLAVYYLHYLSWEQFEGYHEGAVRLFEEIVTVYQQGTWREIASVRWGLAWQLYVKVGVGMAPFMFAFFLWGMAAARRASPAAVREKLTGKFGLGAFFLFLLGGLVFNASSAVAWYCESVFVALSAPDQFLVVFFAELGGPLLAVAYLIGLALWWNQASCPAFLRSGLAAVGRTALSNYLLQSLIGTTLFYGYGFGLYGRFGVAWAPLFAAGIFALQMVLSRYWLGYFRFGPAEWLWRYLTYRQWAVGSDRGAGPESPNDAGGGDANACEEGRDGRR